MAVGGVFACALSLAALAQLGGSPAPSPSGHRSRICRMDSNCAPASGPLYGSESTAACRPRCGGPYRFAGLMRRRQWSWRREKGVDGTAVAQLTADELAPGTTYSLQLAATDGETSSGATVQLLVTDPAYSLIPLDEGIVHNQ